MSLALFAISEKTGSFVVKRMAHWSPILFYHNAKGSFVAFTPVSAFLYGFRERRTSVFPSGERDREYRAGRLMVRNRVRFPRESEVQMKPFRPGFPFRGDFRLLLGGLSRDRAAVGSRADGRKSPRSARGPRRSGASVHAPVPAFSIGAGRFVAARLFAVSRRQFWKQGRPPVRAYPQSLEAVCRFARNPESELKREMEVAVAGMVGFR